MSALMLRTLAHRLFSSAAALFAPAAPAPRAPTDEAAPPGRSRLLDFSTHSLGDTRAVADALSDRLAASAPRLTAAGQAMDASGVGPSLKLSAMNGTAGIPDAVFSWYGAQGFIGYQMCAIIAQHWLIEKACAMPGRDAIRTGFSVALDDAPDDTVKSEALNSIHKASKRYGLNKQMAEWVRLGRVFGIRIAIFQVESTDPRYYENPFNPDSVTPGSFKGISQVDPYWCTPELNGPSVMDPASQQFYEPTWWVISGKRYHRSHLVIFRTAEPPDLLKPHYLYGGVPVPQRIMERVYAAERTANEAPQLAMTKRLTVWSTNVAEILANEEAFTAHMLNFVALRDNYGLKINDTEDTMQQFDTSLTDLDETIMMQYQLVAAGANVPATKLLGTPPRGGINATGEYEEASYHEELEAIQENDLTKFLDRYFEILLRSDTEPEFGILPGTLHASVEWNPLDSATGEEEAGINKTKAERDEILVNIGAIDGQDVRNRIRVQKDSDYTGIEEVPLEIAGADPLDLAIANLTGGEIGEDPLERATAALSAPGGAGGGADPLTAATAALGHGGTGLTLEQVTAALTGGDSLDLPLYAGVILTRPDGKTLWVKRSPDALDEPGKWAWPGGSIEPGEKPQDAALRELLEETGIDYGAPLIPVGVVKGFVAFAAVTVSPVLDVRLDREHTEYQWRSLDDPPRPLHKGVKVFLNV